MVTWHLTMKLFPAKCHEWATSQNLWRQTGKQFTVTREMLTAVARDQRWPDVVAGISARFSKFAFVLFCYITNHLMTGPLGNSEFCFPRISMFPLTSSRETLRFSGNKIHWSPRDQSLSVNCLLWTSCLPSEPNTNGSQLGQNWSCVLDNVKYCSFDVFCTFHKL